MRNHQTSKGAGHEGGEYSRPNRKGAKRGNAGDNYATSSTNNVSQVTGTAAQMVNKVSSNAPRATSSRSHSNNQGNGGGGRKGGTSVKKHSSKAAHLNLISQGKGRKTNESHNIDPSLQIQRDASLIKEDNGYHAIPRSSSKMKHKHRKLTRQASSVAGRNDVTVVSPQNAGGRQSTENQFYKLKTAIQNGGVGNQHKMLPPELISSATAGLEGANMQHILEKQSFGGQPDFIIAGHNNGQSGIVHQQTFSSATMAIPMLPNTRIDKSSSPVPFHSEKQARTFTMKATTPQGFSNQAESGMLSASGKFVIAGINGVTAANAASGVNNSGLPPDRSVQVQLSFELSRQQQMLQQQVRQQQNYKQHMQSVHLEIKGSTAAPQQQQQLLAMNGYMGAGPKQIITVPQSHINANLTQGVALNGNSPRLPEMHGSPGKGQSVFVHLTGGKVNTSSRTQHVGHAHSITKTLETQQTPHFEGQLGSLQNSNSPFKPKQSHKLLRSSLNPGSIRDSFTQQQSMYNQDAQMTSKMTPETDKKKQVSARTVRKASAKKGPVKNNIELINNIQGPNQKTISFPQAQGHIKTVPVASVLGQKSLKTHTSQHLMISSSPEKLAAKQAEHQSALRCKGNFFATGADPNGKVPQNMSGLLNMSKQRAYTMDADQNSEPIAPEIVVPNTAEQNSMVPRELRLPQTSQHNETSSSKKAFRVKNEKQRSDSQQATRTNKVNHHSTNVATSSLPGAYNTSTKNNNFGKKTSIALIGSDGGGSFQKSGKQIIQGKQQLLNHQQKQMMVEQINSAAYQNKTLPLSIFEMQFYQGDFVLQQQQQQNAQNQQQAQGMHSTTTKANFVSKQSSNSQQHQQTSQQSQQVKLAANGVLQPQQFLTKNGLQTASMSSMIKHASTLQDIQYHTPQQEHAKVNLMPQQPSMNTQWLASHANQNVYAHQQMMPQRNSGSGSQSNLGAHQHTSATNHSSASPMKSYASGSKYHHGHNLSLTANTSQQGITMQNILQQNKGYLPAHILQQHMMGAVNSQAHHYGGPVQVNGRQMSMAPQTLMGINPQNFSQMAQTPPGINGSPPLLPLHPNRALQTEIQQAYMNGITDPFELMQLQNQISEHFSHQMYAMQIQSHQKANQQSFQESRKRRDNNMFKRAVSKIPFENAYVEDCYKFIIGYGNNSSIIRNALKQRSWWIEIQPVHSMFNFKWNPVSDGIKFARLGHVEPTKREQGSIGVKPAEQNAAQDKFSLQMVNHMEHHQLLTEKYNLLMVMQRFCDLHKENTFDLMPITFFVEIADASRENLVTQALTPFATLFQTLEANKNKLDDLKQQLIRQLHNKIELEEKEAADIATGGKPNQALVDKLLRLESVNGVHAQSQNSGKITKFKTFNFQKNTYQKYTMPLSHFDSFNLWLLKPTHLNRGRGIHVFNDLETLNKLIKQYCTGKEEGSRKKDQQQANKESPDKLDKDDAALENTGHDQMPFDAEIDEFGQGVTNAIRAQASPQKKQSSSHNKIKHNTFVIQKYVERPLLIFKRKFDIRVWVILTQDHDLYFFKEGYLRTSSSEFGIDLQNIDNAFVHLTNNAVQKHAENYGDHEDGNMLSFPQFQDYIDKNYAESNVNVYDHLVPQMHEVIVKTFNAVKRTIDPNRRKFCFELFGYDFILDEDFNSWLIEVNTNPCLEESSDLLKRLLPRMIEDMFRLTVDVVFPKNSIRKRKDWGKKGKGGGATGSPTKTGKSINDLSSSPLKRIGTAKKTNSIQLQALSDEQKYRMGGNTDTEQVHTPVASKTNSTDANSIVDPTLRSQTQQASDQGEFSDINREDGAMVDKHVTDQTQLMTIKEKLSRNRVYPVPGYNDASNMWHRIGNVEKDPIPTSAKFPNNKSVYMLQVQDKIFKMRKNPAYTGPLNLPELPVELIEEANAAEEAQAGVTIAEEEDEANVGADNNEDL